MTTELTYLMLTALLAGILWIPAVVGQVASRGALRPEDYVTLPTAPLKDWATRANRAHQNMVENFSIFAATVLTAHLLDIHTGLTVAAVTVFFWARLAHAAVFIAGVKQAMLRTVIFTVAWIAWLVLLIEVFRGGMGGVPG